MEVWKKIPLSRGQYEASSYGQIRNARTGRILKPVKNPNRVDTISLNGFMSGRKWTISQLVAMAFMPDKKGIVRHKDGDLNNNHVENLEVLEKDYD